MRRTRSIALLVLLGLTSCSRSCQPVQRCSTAGFLAPSAPLAPPPQPPASVAWTASTRTAALEATFELARARIARQSGERDEALLGYAHGVRLLAAEHAPTALVALSRTLEEEAAALRRSPYEAKRELTGEEVSPISLAVYDVRDLVAAMADIGFPRVEVVGPEGTREEPVESVLGGQLYALLPASAGPVDRAPLTELETKPGVLLLRARSARRQAMAAYLETLRATWRALWPEAFQPR